MAAKSPKLDRVGRLSAVFFTSKATLWLPYCCIEQQIFLNGSSVKRESFLSLRAKLYITENTSFEKGDEIISTGLPLLKVHPFTLNKNCAYVACN